MTVSCVAPSSYTRTGARLDERLFGEVVADVFAGWGGASLGVEMATGNPVAVCVNHCPEAIRYHAINHPHARHIETDVYEVDPRDALGGRLCGLAWFSPDCRHFSRARGAAPVSARVRSLAWVVVKWATVARPRVLMIENVREFMDWGPIRKRRTASRLVVEDGSGRPVMEPIPGRKGETFRRWVSMLRRAGYDVEWKVLDAAEHGAPQHRRRLFVIARCDGKPVKWAAPTHARPQDAAAKGLKPYRTAAECIDWSIPCPSIFDRKLAEKTQRRIAMGIKRFVLDNPHPFIVHVNHGGSDFRSQSVDAPMSTGAHGQALVVPSLATTGYGEREGQGPRVRGVDEPMTTVVGGGRKAAIIAPTLVGLGGADYAAKPRDIDRPAGTTVPHSRAAVCAAFLAQFYGGMVGKPADAPTPSVTAIDHNALIRMNFGEKLIGNSVPPPVVAALVRANVSELCK